MKDSPDAYVSTTPSSRIAELFPHNWAKARLAEAADAAMNVAELAK